MATYGFFTLLLCFTSIVWAQRTPVISHITQMQVQNVGSSVTLECIVKIGDDTSVSWVKYDHQQSHEGLPLTNNFVLITHDSRFYLRYDWEEETYTLSIRNLQETDSGWYQCQVNTSMSNNITAEVELRVITPPLSSRSPLVLPSVELVEGSGEGYISDLDIPAATQPAIYRRPLPTGPTDPSVNWNVVLIAASVVTLCIILSMVLIRKLLWDKAKNKHWNI